jgi:peptidoglycan/xylan/chitin deacetylase (PgdA/CDA1 family)
MLEWAQLPALPRDRVEVGAHSCSHPHLDTLRERRAREEVTRSKALLEDALEREVATFAYPHGYSGRRVRRLVREAGYRSACGVKETLSAPGDDRYALARLMVRATTPAGAVGEWLDRRGAPPPRRREQPRTALWRAYRRGRAVATGRAGSDPGWPSGPR